MRAKCKTITRSENRSLEDVTYIHLILATYHPFLEFLSSILQQLVPEGRVYKYNDRSALFLIAGLKIFFPKRADSPKLSKSKERHFFSFGKEEGKKKRTSFSFKWGRDRLEGARFPRIVLPADFRMNEIRLETIDYADLNNRLSHVCRRDFYFLCRESSSREIPSFLPLPFFLLWFMQTSGKFLDFPFSRAIFARNLILNYI